MTKNDIIRMALAGKQNLRDRIEYAMALEREACAQTVAAIAGDEQYRWAALAIRERGAP